MLFGLHLCTVRLLRDRVLLSGMLCLYVCLVCKGLCPLCMRALCLYMDMLSVRLLCLLCMLRPLCVRHSLRLLCMRMLLRRRNAACSPCMRGTFTTASSCRRRSVLLDVLLVHVIVLLVVWVR